MTERLYYNDPRLRAFDASVASVERADGRVIVTLDRTAFYPTSGGQPFDTGTLADLPLVDVFDRDDGTIAHVIEEAGPKGPALQTADARPGPSEPAMEIGQTVHGTIDWPRRFDHMQQHSGQHILSAVCDRLFQARTLSFHLGADSSTIDLNRELSPADLEAAEQAANAVVWENHPVAIRYASAEEAARLPLRKESLRDGTLRLIDIEGSDLSACGGTHVDRTGEIGVIAVTSWERFKGGQRVEFLCGTRAGRRMRAWRDTVANAVRLMSVLPAELPAAIERLQADVRDQQKRSAALQAELAVHRAAALRAAAKATPKGSLVIQAVDADAAGLKAMATSLADTPGSIVALVSASTPALIVVARAADVSLDARQVVAAVTSRLGGRGGGRPELAQAGGVTAPSTEILDVLRSTVLGS